MAKTTTTKALPGSAEETLHRLNEAIRESIREAGLITGGFYITDTFPDEGYVVVCRWGEGYEDSKLFRVEFTHDGDEIAVGSMREVQKVYVEQLVDPGSGGAGGDDSDGDEAGTVTTKGASLRRKVRAGFTVKAMKEADDDVGGWIGTGTFSVFEKQDYSKDVVKKGATKRSIKTRLPKIKDHHGVTVGQATSATETDEGLEVEYRIYPTSAGRDLAILMQPIETDHGAQAPVQEGSIGFSPAPGGAKKNAAGGWDFTDLDIWEVSPVTFGDNPYTAVSLKSADQLAATPTLELLEHAGEVLRAAVEGPGGVKVMRRRRVAEDRDLKAEAWKAVDALLVDALDTARDLVVLKATAGKLDVKAASSTQLRHTRAVIDSLSDLIHGRGDSATSPAPAVETNEEEDELEGSTTDAGQPKRGGAKAPGAKAAAGAEALPDLDLEIARSAFERMSRAHVLGG